MKQWTAFTPLSHNVDSVGKLPKNFGELPSPSQTSETAEENSPDQDVNELIALIVCHWHTGAANGQGCAQPWWMLRMFNTDWSSKLTKASLLIQSLLHYLKSCRQWTDTFTVQSSWRAEISFWKNFTSQMLLEAPAEATLSRCMHFKFRFYLSSNVVTNSKRNSSNFQW